MRDGAREDITAIRVEGLDESAPAPGLLESVAAADTSSAQRKVAMTGTSAVTDPEVVASSPDEYARKIRQEIELWSQIVKDNQIKVE